MDSGSFSVRWRDLTVAAGVGVPGMYFLAEPLGFADSPHYTLNPLPTLNNHRILLHPHRSGDASAESPSAKSK